MAGVCIALAMIQSWNVWHARNTELKASSIDASNMARALAQHARDTIGKSDSILIGLAERIRHDGVMPAARERLQGFLQVRMQAHPELQNLTFINAAGMRLVASEQPVREISVADREYFIFHRSHTDLGAHIGPPIRSRTTNDWLVTVSRRVNAPDGSFDGVVVASIHMAYFKKFYQSFDIGAGGSVVLLRDNGTLLLRLPFDESLIGRDFSSGPLYQTYLRNGPVGNATITSRIDGVERLVAYRHLDQYPLLIGVALAKNEVLASWRRVSLTQAGLLATFMIILSALGIRLVRQLQLGETMQNALRNAHDELEAMNRSLQQQALQDGLTGLFNRRQFDLSLAAEFGRAMRNQQSLGLVMLDVDCFKQYNDLYGHIAGDNCLKAISLAARQALHRSADSVARYGGEEFAVLLPDTDLDGALAVAERIREAIQALNISHAASPAGVVTISAGVHALIPAHDAENAIALIEYADLALYEAKCSGRNRIGIFKFASLECVLPVTTSAT